MKWLERIDPEKALKWGHRILRIAPLLFGVVWLLEFGLLLAFALSPERHRFLELGAKHQWGFWVCLSLHLLVAVSLLFAIIRGLWKSDRALVGLSWFASIIVMGNLKKIITKEKALVERPSQFLLLTCVMGFWIYFLIKILPNRAIFWSIFKPESESAS